MELPSELIQFALLMRGQLRSEGFGGFGNGRINLRLLRDSQAQQFSLCLRENGFNRPLLFGGQVQFPGEMLYQAGLESGQAILPLLLLLVVIVGLGCHDTDEQAAEKHDCNSGPDASLLRRYDDMKVATASGGADAYWKAKDALLREVLTE